MFEPVSAYDTVDRCNVSPDREVKLLPRQTPLFTPDFLLPHMNPQFAGVCAA